MTTKEEGKELTRQAREKRTNFLETITTDESGKIVITRSGVMGNLTREFDTGV